MQYDFRYCKMDLPGLCILSCFYSFLLFIFMSQSNNSFFSLKFFFQGYVMERRICFIEEGPEGQGTTHFWHNRPRVQPTLPKKGSTQPLTDYSRHLHFPTSTRQPLNNPARRHNSASSEIRSTTALKDGVAPSKTTSFRWRQRHQQIRVTAVQRSLSLPGPPRFDWSQGTKQVSACGIQ
jgi:hypothetical protein